MTTTSVKPPTGSNESTSRRHRQSGSGIVAALLLAAGGVAVVNHPAAMTIMTQNMDAGTELGSVLALGAPIGVDLTRGEIVASDIPARADLLAAAIAFERPDLVALQEAALWRTGGSAASAIEVLFDPLESLLAGLAARGTPYDIVAVNSLTDVALPASSGEFLRYTDRDALLIRAGQREPAFRLANIHTQRFTAALDYRGLPILQGWIATDVHQGGRQFRLVATHLESVVDGFPEATDVQVAQSRELLRSLGKLTTPVVLCGDFNSDAEGGGFIDSTPSVDLIKADGYADCWKSAHPLDPGYTWPFVRKGTSSAARVEPFERIDLFFARGLAITNLRRVAALARDPATGRFASDHCGVVATFHL
jgi:hypothetical protein